MGLFSPAVANLDKQLTWRDHWLESSRHSVLSQQFEDVKGSHVIGQFTEGLKMDLSVALLVSVDIK